MENWADKANEKIIMKHTFSSKTQKLTYNIIDKHQYASGGESNQSGDIVKRERKLLCYSS